MPIPTATLPKLCARPDDGFAERRVDLVGGAVGDEGAIELEFGKRRFLKLRQGRIGAAEMVDRQIDIKVAQFLGDLAR